MSIACSLFAIWTGRRDAIFITFGDEGPYTSTSISAHPVIAASRERRRLRANPPHQQANLSKHSPTLDVRLSFSRKSKENLAAPAPHMREGRDHRRSATPATCCNWRILAHAATRGGHGGKRAQQFGGVLLLRLCSKLDTISIN
jgi:hypothetical protein